jgi:ABC-2 type transport system ATP-binding protein
LRLDAVSSLNALMNEQPATSGDAVLDASDIAALAVKDLSHSFGARKALDGVSFAVAAGSFTVLLGPNGAGKTTLFSLVTRLYNNRVGSIRVFGFEVRHQPSEALARIGAIFQQRTLDLDLTVADNLRYHAALHGMSRRDAKERIATELGRAGLLDRLNDKVRSLSGGQMRRVEIAGALLHRPRLLLLDEPTVGVDIGSRQAILDHVHRLCREDDLGVLWATHLIDEVNPGDHVVVLHRGRILAHGDVEDVARAAGAANIREAFTKLTETGRP